MRDCGCGSGFGNDCFAFARPLVAIARARDFVRAGFVLAVAAFLGSDGICDCGGWFRGWEILFLGLNLFGLGGWWRGDWGYAAGGGVEEVVRVAWLEGWTGEGWVGGAGWCWGCGVWEVAGGGTPLVRGEVHVRG